VNESRPRDVGCTTSCRPARRSDLARLQALDLALVHVEAEDMVADVGEACAGDEAHVPVPMMLTFMLAFVSSDRWMARSVAPGSASR
jgi:hypothetical protein